ncbi:MAG TPA: Holliday junction resolvase RuvX, partial [Dehalococcoidia bacterium]
TIIEHENRASDLARVSELAAEHDATTIVVGVPLDSARGDTQQSRLIRRFGAQLEQSVDLPVVYHDESYSTVAVEPVPAKRPRGKRPKARLDDLAAAVILQSYIDAQESAS